MKDNPKTRAAFAARGTEAQPVDHLEAIFIEPEQTRHPSMVRDVAQRVANAPNPGDSIKEISDRFFRRPPIKTESDDLGEVNLDEIAPAPSPDGAGDPLAVSSMTGGHTSRGVNMKQDERRPTSEIVLAAKVVEMAVLLSRDTMEAADRAARVLMSTAAKIRDDPGASAALRTAAGDIGRALSASGTMTPARTAADDAIDEAQREAFRSGDVDRAVVVEGYARTWHELHEAGKTTVSLARYITLQDLKT